MEEGQVTWWVQIYPAPEWWVFLGKKRGRWNDAPIMPSAYCTSLWGQCYDLGLLQLVRSKFSNIMCPKNEVSWLPEYIEWPRSSTNGFFLPWWHGHIPRWQCQGSSDSNCERMVQGALDIISHIDWLPQSPVLTPLRIFGVCWRRLCAVVQLSHHQYKILEKNECNTGWK